MSVTVTIKSPKYPPSTVVKAFLPYSNRHYEGRPSGTASTEGTVGSDGKLSLTLDGESIYALWAEVAGTNANVQLGSIGFTAPPESLLTRVKERREALGII